jgi:hypothetical protein
LYGRLKRLAPSKIQEDRFKKKISSYFTNGFCFGGGSGSTEGKIAAISGGSRWRLAQEIVGATSRKWVYTVFPAIGWA